MRPLLTLLRPLAVAGTTTGVVFLMVVSATAAPTGTISTHAGTGEAGFLDGPRLAAKLGPSGMDLYPTGGYLFADPGNQRVRLVRPDGQVVTVAGSGTQGYSGDGGNALAAGLNFPHDVAVLADGSFLIADSGNKRIRYVTAPQGPSQTRTISTAAGTGISCNFAVDPQCGAGLPGNQAPATWPSSVSLNPSGGFFYTEHSYDSTGTVTAGPSRVRLVYQGNVLNWVGSGVTGYNGDSGQAQTIRLNFPSDASLAPDGTSLIISDGNNCKLRKLVPGGQTTVIAGTGSGNCAVPGNWPLPLSGVGDGLPGAQASLLGPSYVGFDADGNIFLADLFNLRIRYLTRSGSRIDTVAGSGSGTAPLFAGDGGPATQAKLFWPSQALPFYYAGGLFFLISDSGNKRIRIVAASGSTGGASLRSILAGAKPSESWRRPASLTSVTPGSRTPGPRPLLALHRFQATITHGHIMVRVQCPIDPNGQDCVGFVRFTRRGQLLAASKRVTLRSNTYGRVTAPLRRHGSHMGRHPLAAARAELATRQTGGDFVAVTYRVSLVRR